MSKEVCALLDEVNEMYCKDVIEHYDIYSRLLDIIELAYFYGMQTIKQKVESNPLEGESHE